MVFLLFLPLKSFFILNDTLKKKEPHVLFVARQDGGASPRGKEAAPRAGQERGAEPAEAHRCLGCQRDRVFLVQYRTGKPGSERARPGLLGLVTRQSAEEGVRGGPASLALGCSS